VITNPYPWLARAFGMLVRAGLYDWKVELTNDPVFAGMCLPEKRTIEISTVFMTDDEEVYDTICHEITHACRVVNHHTESFERDLVEMKARFR
jgi:hypothetical protein